MTKNKTKKPEISILSWMIEPEHNNVIINIEGTGTKIVLDSLESSIWSMINDNYDTLEILICAANENGISKEKTVQVIYNLEKERIVILRSNSIWEEEEV